MPKAILTLLTLLLAVLLTGRSGLALEITSVVPTRATPATEVVLTGGLFSPQSRIYLGEQFVPASRVLPRQLEFIVPPLPAGTYSLTVQDAVDMAVQPFNFEVLALPPQITAVAPENLDVCADESDRLIRVEGSNLLPETQLLLDGKAVGSSFIDPGAMEFRLPELPAGVYGIEARNPDGTASLPQSLWVDNVPEITGVERGGEYVNYYEMIIHGKNFFYNSILVVREPNIFIGGTGTRQLTYYANRGAPGAGPSDFHARGETLRYYDCRTLLYLRYPNNFDNKELTLQVINPDGKKTVPYAVTLP